MVYRRLFDFPAWRIRGGFDELERMRHEMHRLFDGLAGGLTRTRGAGVFPLVNLTEDKDNYFVRAELPGMDTAELDIQATVNSLAITGERKIAAEGENVKYHRKEREAGKFSRMINLPEAIDPEKIEAKLANGILTVVIPKSEVAKPRQIKIQ